MKAVSGSAIAGDVHMIVHKASGEITKELTFSNLVLDVGYKELFKRMSQEGLSTAAKTTPADITTHLFLGTGTTAPTFLDTGLENRSGTLPAKASSPLYEMHDEGKIVDHDNQYYEVWFQRRFVYGEGAAEGVWTELGLADVNYAYPFTRALIKDETGTPISLTILSDEYLTVLYTLRFISEPQDLGDIVVNGVTSSVMLYPTTRDQSEVDDFLSYLTYGVVGSMRNIYSYTSFIFSDFTTISTSTPNAVLRGNVSHVAGYEFSGSAIFDPTENDLSIPIIMMQSGPGSSVASAGALVFDPPLNKRADYRLTIDINIDWSPHDGPVTGLAEAATATSLDFTWDAYPGVTEYQLVLRQAGTVISSQTVTAPTATASFTGLTASTEYHLDIKPIATPRNGRRLIHAASTTA